MRLGPHRPAVRDLQVDDALIGVVALAERAEGRPHQAVLGVGAPIGFQLHLSAQLAHAQLLFVRVDQLQSVLGPLAERRAVPDLLVRAVRARLRIAAPSGHRHLGHLRRQARPDHAIFDQRHGEAPLRQGNAAAGGEFCTGRARASESDRPAARSVQRPWSRRSRIPRSPPR